MSINSKLNKIYYSPSGKNFYLLSLDSHDKEEGGMTIHTGNTHIESSSWWWQQEHYICKDWIEVCDTVALFKAIEAKFLDKNNKA